MKTIRACLQNNIKTVCVAGGVSANSYLREMLTKFGKDNGIKVLFPKFEYCTDNAAMIGSFAYFMLKQSDCAPLNIPALPTVPLK